MSFFYDIVFISSTVYKNLRLLREDTTKAAQIENSSECQCRFNRFELGNGEV